VSFSGDRVRELLDTLEQLAAGDTTASLALSPHHDELDAIAFGINVLADELRWVHARVRESDRVKADELREQLAHLGRVTMADALTGSIAHEINQPLTAVMANAEAALRLLAHRPPKLAELRETLAEIVNDNRRAGDVVRRMRALLKKEPTRREAVDVNDSVGEVVKLIQGTAVARGVSLDVELAAGVRPVEGDRIQIQQVVLNLLLNAFDAVEECAPPDRRVRMRTFRADRMAGIEVTDFGEGLPDDALAHVFEPFFTTKRDGMGIGLSICRTIVEAHGGTLDAARHPGRGLTFSARLPLLEPPPAEQPGRPERRLQEQD
jgi:two-component system sensor kinase FixL